jgi:hypothetical protein
LRLRCKVMALLRRVRSRFISLTMNVTSALNDKPIVNLAHFKKAFVPASLCLNIPVLRDDRDMRKMADKYLSAISLRVCY